MRDVEKGVFERGNIRVFIRASVAVLCFSLLFAGVCVASATEIYVATWGSDSGAGTIEDPWQHPAYAANVAEAGDTIYLLDGTWNDEHIVFANSGTETHPITLKAYSGTPTLDGVDKTGIGIGIKDKSYISISGFLMKNYEVGIDGDGLLRHLTISDFTIDDIGTNGISFDAASLQNSEITNFTIQNTGWRGISHLDYSSTDCHDVTISNFTIRNSGSDSINWRNSQRVHIHHGEVYDPGGDGVIFQLSVDDSIMEDIKVYNAGWHGLAIMDHTEGSYPCHNNIIKDCYVSYAGHNAIDLHSGAFNTLIENCEITGDSSMGAGIYFHNGGEGLIVRGCTIYGDSSVEHTFKGIEVGRPDVLVEDCTLYNLRTAIDACSGDPDDIVIRNNVIYSTTYESAIHISPLNNALIESNTIGEGEQYRVNVGKGIIRNGLDTIYSVYAEYGGTITVEYNNGKTFSVDGSGNYTTYTFSSGWKRIDVLSEVATGTITGIVTTTTGSPIEGAIVTVEVAGESDETDSYGVYSITDVPVGTYTVTASALGYEDTSVPLVEINKDEITTLNFQLIDESVMLASYWKFDEGSGDTAHDSSGNNNDGTIQGASWTEGKLGTSLSFDGTDDHLDCGQDSSLKITGAITVEAWVKWPGTGNPYFVTKFGGPGRRSYDLSGNADGTVEFRVGGADCNTIKSSGSAPIPTGEWVYLVGTYEPSSYVRLFVNGALAKEETTAIPAAQGDNGLPWYIGAREGYVGWFSGIIDEVKIHNGALSAEEIRANYDANPTNNPPTAIIDSITPETAEQGKDNVSFSGHGTDTDGLVVAYNWRSSMDGQLSAASSYSRPATELSAGTHTIYFKVQNDKGAWSTEVTDDLTINQEPENRPPVADLKGPYTGTEGAEIVYDGSGSYDPDGSIVAYEWDFGDGNTATGVAPTHTYAQDGTYTVALTVTDNDGAINMGTTTATIADTEPTADLSASTTCGDGPLTVTFTDNSASYDGIVEWAWDFDNDDVTDSTVQNPTHVYAEDGEYTVSLTVTESEGDSNVITKMDYITVTKVNNAPYAPDNPSPSDGATDVSIDATLSWTGGDPDDEDTVTYEVHFGTSINPPLVVENQPGTTYDPSILDHSTEYYWQIVATDNHGASAESEVWNFVTDSAPSHDLVAEWDLDAGSGETAVDSSGNGNDGTLVNNPAWVTGKVGKALSFDGTNDYVDCGQGSSLRITGAITVEAWVKWMGDGNPYFVTKIGGPGRRSYDLSGNEGGTVEFRVGGADCKVIKSSGSAPIATGEWVHLAGTYEPSNYVRLFVNGALAKEDTTSIPAAQGDNELPWYIGAREGTVGWFSGVIDEVKIYCEALSEEEIKAKYEAYIPNKSPFTPSNPSPSDGATDMSIDATLSWTGGDPDDEDTVTYEVYFGTSINPPLVVENQSGTTYDPGILDHSTEYYWRIVATDNHGASNESGVWNFTTASSLNLVANWHLNEGTGEIAGDSSGNGNDGTLVNNPTWVNGKVVKALSFDGTNDYVDCGQDTSLMITGAITVEAWVKWTGDGNPYFVTKIGGPGRRSYDLSGNEGGTVEFRVGGADCNTIKSSGSAPIATGEWVHLAGTYEPSNYVRLFVNGALAKESTTAIPAAQGDNGLPWYIGAREGNHGWFNGIIDEVKIYCEALSEEEIRSVLGIKPELKNHPLCADPNGTYTNTERIEYIWLEAESANILTPDFEVASDTSASKGKYIEIPNGLGWCTNDGEATYTISIDSLDNYVIWGRKIAATKECNSFFVQIDDDTRYDWTTALSEDWEWDAINHWGSGEEFMPEIDPVVFSLSAGEHTLRIIQREGGAKLDKLLITNDMSFVPC